MCAAVEKSLPAKGYLVGAAADFDLPILGHATP
jgi:hypothetical protein